MNNALFGMSIKDAADICKECGVLKSYIKSAAARKVVMSPIDKFEDYKQYATDLQVKGEYDILLNDDSLFQFEGNLNKDIIVDGKKIKYDHYKYLFVQSPYRRLTFDEYMDGIDRDEPDYNEELYREMFENDSLLGDNPFPFYLRYDVDMKGYKPNSHSYAHLHIGFNEGYRMPVSLILTPKAFVCMVLKLVYPNQWNDNIVSVSRRMEKVYSSLKSQCIDNKNPYWIDCEQKDLFIG